MKSTTKNNIASKKYLVDTSAIINKKVSLLAKKGLSGIIFIPNAVIAELENLANKGQNVGFNGLEEIAKLHHFKRIKMRFIGPRPSEHQIKYAKSGEIDALIRSLAYKLRATLITSDLVQAKSAQAYNIPVQFMKVIWQKKKRFSLFKKIKLRFK
jgi:ATPase